MVNVGVVGLGPAWEHRYLPVLNKMRDRIAVRSVYDCVGSRARQTARNLETRAASGLLAMAQRSDIDGVLLVDPAWYGSAAADLLLESDAAVYIAGPLAHSPADLDRLYARAVSEGRTLMPAMDRRFTPATNRLQELIATRLGPPQRICVDVNDHSNDSQDVPANNAALPEWIDWCSYLFQTQPTSIEARPLGDGSATPTNVIQVTFDDDAQGRPRQAELRYANQPALDAPQLETQHEIECQSGSARLSGETCISWKNGEGTAKETLNSERCGIEVTLDQFCRRVVGGLVPIAGLNDVCRCLRAARGAEESLRAGHPVHLDRPAI